MSEGISRIQSRIREIQALLDEPARPNEEFGRELRAAGEEPEPTLWVGRPGPVSGSAPEALQPYIQEAAAKTGLSPDLIQAVIATESNYRADAVSPVGAQGLMQLMPGTARGLGVQNPFDPRENILGGAEYLRQQLTRFGGVEKALAAYNAGPGAVARYGGIPPYRETQGYVRKVLSRLHQLEEKRE